MPRRTQGWLMVVVTAGIAACGLRPVLAQEVAEISVERCLALRQSDPARAVEMAGRLLADSGLSALERGRALVCQAYAQATTGQPQAAVGSAEAAVQWFGADTLSVAERVRGYAGAAGALLTVGEPYRATAIMEQAERLVRDADDSHAQLIVADLLANIHAAEFDDHAAAETYFTQAHELAQSLHIDEPSRDYNQGLNLLHMGRLDEAGRVLDRALAGTVGNDRWDLLRHRIRSSQAELALRRQDLAGARAQLLDLVREQQRLGDRQGEVVSLTRLAQAQLAGGDAATAAEVAQRALDLAVAGKFTREQVEALRVIVDVDVARGETQAALTAARELHALETQRLKVQNLRGLATMQAQLHDHQVAQENARLHMQGVRARLMRNLALAFSTVVLVVGGLFAWWQRRIRRRLHRLGALDPLTGLFNRRESTRRLGARDMRTGAIVLVDADHFKAINDHYGHAAGDRVLVALTQRLQGACRPSDMLARWGGEEFLLVCPGLDREQAERFADRLRSVVAATPVELDDGQRVAVTISLGFAALVDRGANGGSGWQDAVRVADRALYAAKRSGRDAWAGLWIGAERPDWPLRSIKADPRAAAAAGVVELCGSRALDWGAPAPAPQDRVAANRDGPAGGPLCLS